LKEAFTPKGGKFACHDPSDTGNDAKGYSLRHGSIFLKIKEKRDGEIDEGCDWATDMAIKDGADWFIWDGDGMGAGLKRQVADAFRGTKVQTHMFRGSLSGIGQDNADDIYLPADETGDKPETYADTFTNNRSQYSILWADKFYNTYLCVVKGKYMNPDDMVSIDSDGVESKDRLRSEVCRIPRKKNNTGLLQIMSKEDMKKLKIESPNMWDTMMMSGYQPPIEEVFEPINYIPAGIV
jgi:phage terminase large subunit